MVMQDLGKWIYLRLPALNDTSWTEWSVPIESWYLAINTSNKEYGYKISTDGTKAYNTQVF